MANEEHLAILRQGFGVWNAWRKANPDVRLLFKNAHLEGVDLHYVYLVSADLTGAHLEGADLSGADIGRSDFQHAYLNGANLGGGHFMEANLAGADLRKANLTRINLYRADLTQANLHTATLTEAYLQAATLTGANLTDADLTAAFLGEVDFTGVELAGASLTHAELGRSNFGDNDLRSVQGLATVRHWRQSFIGVNTLYRSGGKIPEVFLRGCGVPDALIEYLPSLLGAMEPIQFYSCFISYSTKDEEFAKRLYSKMRDNNLRVWFANEDLKGGYKLHEQIDEAIRVYDKFIVVLSPESLRSKWVMNEVRRTRKAELANNQRKFFPIGLLPYKELEDWECLDPETGTDLAAEIREYYVPDFRDWKNHDSFEKAFAQLLEGLKAVDAPPVPRAARTKVSGDAPLAMVVDAMTVRDPDDLILQNLVRLEALHKRAIPDFELARQVSMDAQLVRDYLELLEKDGYVKLITYRGDDTYRHTASLTGPGRIHARELEQAGSITPARPSIDYERGLERLRGMVKGNTEFATLEARLLGFLQEERLHGTSENTRAGKSQVIHSLNDFVSSNGLGDSFTDLCR